MANNKGAIKSHIKSVNTIKKITGAMKLISTVKLTKYKNIVSKTVEFNNELENVINQITNSEAACRARGGGRGVQGAPGVEDVPCDRRGAVQVRAPRREHTD